jgi:hypothetical protein
MADVLAAALEFVFRKAQTYGCRRCRFAWSVRACICLMRGCRSCFRPAPGYSMTLAVALGACVAALRDSTASRWAI